MKKKFLNILIHLRKIIVHTLIILLKKSKKTKFTEKNKRLRQFFVLEIFDVINNCTWSNGSACQCVIILYCTQSFTAFNKQQFFHHCQQFIGFYCLFKRYYYNIVYYSDIIITSFIIMTVYFFKEEIMQVMCHFIEGRIITT